MGATIEQIWIGKTMPELGASSSRRRFGPDPL